MVILFWGAKDKLMKNVRPKIKFWLEKVLLPSREANKHRSRLWEIRF